MTWANTSADRPNRLKLNLTSSGWTAAKVARQRGSKTDSELMQVRRTLEIFGFFFFFRERTNGWVGDGERKWSPNTQRQKSWSLSLSLDTGQSERIGGEVP